MPHQVIPSVIAVLQAEADAVAGLVGPSATITPSYGAFVKTGLA
jgi:hypothetical protein